MCPSPQHAGGLPARGVTSLHVAPSFLGDFLEFVSNAASEYRFARGHGAGEHQAQNALTRSASRTPRSRPAFSAGSISAGDSRSTLPGSAAIRSVLVPAASTYLSSCSISFGMLENREPLSVSATTKARLAPAMRSTWVLVEHMAPSMHSRSPIQVGPKTPGNDTLAQTACEIGMLLDCERTSRSPLLQSGVVAWNRGFGQERPRLRISIISWRLRTGGLRAAMAPRPIDWIVATLPSRAASASSRART